MEKKCLKCGAVLVYIEDIDQEIGGGNTKKVGEIWACSKCGETFDTTSGMLDY